MDNNLIASFDFLNLIIALLALLLSLYGIHYTHRLNRHKIVISNGEFLSDEADPPIAWFEINNISPVPVTVTKINFLTMSKEEISPLLEHFPAQTYSVSTGFGNIQMPKIIPDYKYAEPLDAPQIIQPYNSLKLGYYFDSVHNHMIIKVTCCESISLFRKSKSFITHFSDIPD